MVGIGINTSAAELVVSFGWGLVATSVGVVDGATVCSEVGETVRAEVVVPAVGILNAGVWAQPARSRSSTRTMIFFTSKPLFYKNSMV